MRRAIDETDRRRVVQQVHNKKHGITPVGIKKAITDVMGAGYDQRHQQQILQVAEQQAEYAHMSPDKISHEMDRLEKQMYQHARDLEFEEAAAIRDKLDQLKTLSLGA